MFKDFETKHFPEELCTKQDPREEDVRNSDAKFLCVVVNKWFPTEAELKVLSPYTCKDVDDPTVTLFGWVDQWGNIYDHREKDIHGDEIRVISWKKVEEPVDFYKMFGCD